LKLGARILKTGLVVVLTLVITHSFNIGPALLAVIAAVTALQPSLKQSVNYIIQQIEANAIGISCAILAILILGNDPITISLVVMVSIVLNLRLKLEKNIPLSIVTILSMMEATTSNVFVFGLERFGMAMLGGTIALVVNHIFATRDYEKKLNKEFGLLDQKTQHIFKSLLSNHVRAKRIRQEMSFFQTHITDTQAVFSFYCNDYYWISYKKKGSLKKLLAFRRMLAMFSSTHELLKFMLEHRTHVLNKTEGIELHDLFIRIFDLQHRVFSMATGFTYLNNLSEDFADTHSEFQICLEKCNRDHTTTRVLYAMHDHLIRVEKCYNILSRYGRSIE